VSIWRGFPSSDSMCSVQELAYSLVWSGCNGVGCSRLACHVKSSYWGNGHTMFSETFEDFSVSHPYSASMLSFSFKNAPHVMA
jgi:hypothetical protein